MVLLAAFRLHAPWYQFFVHDATVDPQPESFYEDPEDGSAFLGSRKIGYLTTGRTICFGTRADLNVHWAELYRDACAPDFGEAERVIALPLEVSSGRVCVSQLGDLDTPLCTVSLAICLYTLYLLAYNIGVDESSAWTPSHTRSRTEPFSDAELAAHTDFEHYRMVFVPGLAAKTGVVYGRASLLSLD